jgi:hypothetical protein
MDGDMLVALKCGGKSMHAGLFETPTSHELNVRFAAVDPGSTVSKYFDVIAYT